ncbi:MAG: hypothetical protein JWR38_4917 [Mucilaginibacter sp.]|nr:hypothetical protein [Mucilaginibacter sp.]
MSMPVIPQNEMGRLLSLSEFDLDYIAYRDSFKSLAKLAAKIAGTEISQINLIDSFTQWTISSHGFDGDQTPRENSICQHTILNDDYFEVSDLSADDRFKDKLYVTGDPYLRYYYGLPLKVSNGHHIGTLCVLDKKTKALGPEKIELLQIIAGEIVNRLNYLKIIEDLKNNLSETKEIQKKVAHDIRGPLNGIIGLAQIISEQGKSNRIEEVLELINLIHESGKSLLELTDEILKTDKREKYIEVPKEAEFNLRLFKDKLEKLYIPQAINKNIKLNINTTLESETIPFLKNKLLQIAGNLISNAIKFTPDGGEVIVNLYLKTEAGTNILGIQVIDSGGGLNEQDIATILEGTASSTTGTSGEAGYGLGLTLVKHLIETLNGTLNIYSAPGTGATFEVRLPLKPVAMQP